MSLIGGRQESMHLHALNQFFVQANNQGFSHPASTSHSLPIEGLPNASNWLNWRQKE